MTTLRNATNRQIVLRKRTNGLPTPDLFEAAVGTVPTPGEGEVLVHNVYASVDTGMKGWISTAKNYASVETGAVMNSFGVGEVVESHVPGIVAGDYVFGHTGWQEFGIAKTSQAGFRKVDPARGPLSTALGALGHTGVTAYFGLLDVGRPKAGETVLVSTAAGAVGSAVGQIARIKGCRTVGIAGGQAKTALCREAFGYDAAVDYKNTDDLATALRAACPDGVDVFYDNVGGRILDTVIGLMRIGGRIVICGTAGTKSWNPPPTGMRLERAMLVNRLLMQGFIVFDYKDRNDEALEDLYRWYAEGRLVYREDIGDGLEQAPRMLAGLYRGENTGRSLVRVRPDPTALGRR